MGMGAAYPTVRNRSASERAEPHLPPSRHCGVHPAPPLPAPDARAGRTPTPPTKPPSVSRRRRRGTVIRCPPEGIPPTPFAVGRGPVTGPPADAHARLSAARACWSITTARTRARARHGLTRRRYAPADGADPGADRRLPARRLPRRRALARRRRGRARARALPPLLRARVGDRHRARRGQLRPGDDAARSHAPAVQRLEGRPHARGDRTGRAQRGVRLRARRARRPPP